MNIKQLNEELDKILNERFIPFKSDPILNRGRFRGVVNPESGEIIYSTLSPKNNNILYADIKINLNDELEWDEKEVAEVAQKAIDNYKN